MHRSIIVFAVAVFLLQTRVAAADDAEYPVEYPVAEFEGGADAKQACASAYEASQELRLDNQLLAARRQAEFCASDACPGVVRDGCTKWLVELREQQPTFVFSATLGERDVTAVRVYVDGTMVASELDGAPIDIDPGSHRLRMEYGESPAVEDTVVAVVGIKNRQVAVVFEDPRPAHAPRSSESSAEPDGPPVAGFVVGGFGLAALAVFAGLAVTGSQEIDELHESCGTSATCAPDEVDAARTKIIVGDVFLAVGAAGVAVGAGLLIGSYLSDDTDDADVAWTVVPLEGGAGAALGARF